MGEAVSSKLLTEIGKVKATILDQTIEKWDTNDFDRSKKFLMEHCQYTDHTINILQVIGTQHTDYQGLTWRKLLRMGKRMSLNHSLYESNPDYYLKTDRKEPSMSFQCIDGGPLLYVEAGNHRTCIAKASFCLTGVFMLHGVELNDYHIDWNLKRIFDEIEKIIESRELSIYIKPINTVVSCEDSDKRIVNQTNCFLDGVRGEQFLSNLKKKSPQTLIADILRRGYEKLFH